MEYDQKLYDQAMAEAPSRQVRRQISRAVEKAVRPIIGRRQPITERRGNVAVDRSKYTPHIGKKERARGAA